jgi:thioredoxin 1
MMINVNDSDFDAVLKSHNLILIDFWAEWCRPCKIFSPILDEISEEYGIWVGKINVDDNPIKSVEYEVVSIPTVILFKDGKPVKRIIGAKPKHSLVKELKEWL